MDLPCYLVPSSRVRLLVITMTIFLQASRYVAKPHSSVSVHVVTTFMSSSQRARGLPLFLVPPPIPNMIDFSKLFSLRMICPKYDSCCFFISAYSGLVALISSITDSLVLLAVHDIRSSLLQDNTSKLSILLLSAFLIVQDSQPYNTTGKTNACGWIILTTNLAECVCVCAKCDPFLPLRFHFFFKLPEFFFA